MRADRESGLAIRTAQRAVRGGSQRKSRARHQAQRSAQRSELTVRAVELDQGLGGRILGGQSLVILGDGRGDLLGKLLAELDAPLVDRKSTRLNSSHSDRSRMPSSA